MKVFDGLHVVYLSDSMDKVDLTNTDLMSLKKVAEYAKATIESDKVSRRRLYKLLDSVR